MNLSELLDYSIIKQTLLNHGFTIKPGQSDFKPYVYSAAFHLVLNAVAKLERAADNDLREAIEDRDTVIGKLNAATNEISRHRSEMAHMTDLMNLATNPQIKELVAYLTTITGHTDIERIKAVVTSAFSLADPTIRKPTDQIDKYAAAMGEIAQMLDMPADIERIMERVNVFKDDEKVLKSQAERIEQLKAQVKELEKNQRRVPAYPGENGQATPWPDEWQIDGYQGCIKEAIRTLRSIAADKGREGLLPSPNALRELAERLQITQNAVMK